MSPSRTTPTRVGSPVDPTVDVLRASAYWLEEDLDPASGTSALINFAYLKTDPTGGTIVSAVDNLDHKKRIKVARDGTAWTNERIRIRADDVPARSWDPATPEREVYIVIFWEDTARDDADGPPCEIDHLCP